MAYGSLVNMIGERTRSKSPTMGDGLTIFHWTDREAGTVRKVSPDGKKIWFTTDVATRIDKNGMSDCQAYEYKTQTEIPEDKWILATLRKDGKWHIGSNMKGSVLGIGWRDYHYDFSF